MHICTFLMPPCRAQRPAHGAGVGPKAWRRLTLRAVAEAEGTSAGEDANKGRKLSPLERGGTLTGDKAAGKDAGAAALSGGKKAGMVMKIIDDVFVDYRWVDGRWDYSQFTNAEGKVDWDVVIDCEIARRKLLEDNPVASIKDSVKFDTSEIPWWAWVKRFHLPVAEKLNGRAAMLGYAAALIVDQFTGATLLDQQNSFLGKLLMFVTILGVLLFREVGDFSKYKNLLDEAFFYDRQWAASWEGKTRPSETEE